VDDYQFGYITKLKRKKYDYNVFVIYIENLLQKARLFKACSFYPLLIMLGKAPREPI
jgi:hypothetical protein